MSNIFDTENYPLEIPTTLQVNGYWAWKRTDLANDYPTADYSLVYKLNLISGSTAAAISITATEANNEYIFLHTSTNSVTPGDYKYVVKITKTAGGAEAHLETGYVTIENETVRSFAKQMLDAIEAVALNRATMDQSSMSIAGRSLSRMSIDELNTFRDKYKTEYLQEVKMARVKNKQGSGNNIKARFGSTKTYNPTDLT